MEITFGDTEFAARYLGLSASTLNKARVYGNGPKYVKLGKSVRYRLADLDDWIASRVVSSTSQKIAA